jgi:DNA-binding CsgD family transcriptional regulator/tetratricopeptide (TPR) repeat protein
MAPRPPRPPTLLEREPQLAALASLWGEARGGEGRVALVSGEGGIGKTSLVKRLAAELADAPALLWGACDDLFTPRPLGPLEDIALQVGGPLREALFSEAARPRVFSTFLEVLRERPRLLVLEDLHWADEATLDLLRWLGRRLAPLRVLLVGTFRDDAVPPAHPLRGVMGDLAGAGVLRRLPLPPLTPDGVRTLARGLPVDAEALHALTGGNPFLVTETLAAGGSGVAPNVRDAVLARAARLSAPARATLDAAAVSGPRVEPGVLRDVLGPAADGLEECLATGVLEAAGEGLAFRHELARQAILGALTPPRRAALHARALASLRARPSHARSAALLAHHAEGAGDAEAVLAFAPAAARLAAAAGAHRQACEQWALALRFADGLPPAERADLLESFAVQCAAVGRMAEGVAARTAAAGLRRALGQPEREGENLCGLGALYASSGRTPEAEDAARRALALLEPLPPGPALATTYRMHAYLRMLSRDIDEAVAWGERAVALGERLPPGEVQVAALNTLGTALCFSDYGRGCALLERSRAMAQEAGLDAWVASAWLQLGSASGELHRFREAEAHLAQGLAYAHERELDPQHQYMLAWRALTHLFLGRWSDAGVTAERVVRRLDATPLSRSMALVALGRLRARRGDPGVGEALDEAQALARTMTHLQRLAPVAAARAEAALLADDAPRARAEALEVWELALAKRHPWFVGELAWCRHAAGDAVELPDYAAAPYALQVRGDWRGAAAEWERRGCPYEQARALADGDAAARREALALFDRLGARPAAEQLRRRMRQEGERGIPRGPRPATRESPLGLTAREQEVLALVAERESNARVAARLHISPRTVDHHVASILAKLGAGSREEAVERAVRAGLLPGAPGAGQPRGPK